MVKLNATGVGLRTHIYAEDVEGIGDADGVRAVIYVPIDRVRHIVYRRQKANWLPHCTAEERTDHARRHTT